MAERRMFAKSIIGSDSFLDMPATTQLLYFHLGMRADDDGFVGSPRTIMRMIGAGMDDLNLLCTKEYIIPFRGGVVLISHWQLNNYIQKDRYHETIYTEQKATVTRGKNGVYTRCIHNGYKLDTQSRLGKTRLGESPLKGFPPDTGENKPKGEDSSNSVGTYNGGAASEGGPPTVQMFDPYKPETWGEAE